MRFAVDVSFGTPGYRSCMRFLAGKISFDEHTRELQQLAKVQ